MEKVNDIVVILKNYQKIIEITGSAHDPKLDEFIELLKIYKNLSFDEFKQKLVDDNKVNKKKKNLKEEAIDLGLIYYQKSRARGRFYIFRRVVQVYE